MDKAQRQHLDNLRPEATEERQKELAKGANQALHALAPVYSLVILQHSTYAQVTHAFLLSATDLSLPCVPTKWRLLADGVALVDVTLALCRVVQASKAPSLCFCPSCCQAIHPGMRGQGIS